MLFFNNIYLGLFYYARKNKRITTPPNNRCKYAIFLQNLFHNYVIKNYLIGKFLSMHKIIIGIKVCAWIRIKY